MAYDVEDTKNDAFEDIVNQAKKNGASAADEAGRPAGVTDLKIILWSNGFQVQDDGEFRALDDPKNA